VTVTDPNSVCNDPPNAICNPVTVDADVNCTGAAAGADFGLNSNDPDGDDLIFSVSPEGLYALGTTPVTLTVSDGEFSATCTTTITVVDNTAPTAICVEAINVSLAADGTATITTDNIDAGSFDNCGIQSLALNVSSFDCDNVGDNTVELTVTDNANLTNVCTTTVTVQLDAAGNGSITTADINNGSNDACGIQSLALDITNFDCNNVGSGSTATSTVLDFDGSNDVLNLNTNYGFQGNNTFSAELMMKTTDASADLVQRGFAPSRYSGWGVVLRGGKVGFVLSKDWNSGNRIYLSTATPINDGNWHHVAVTYNGNRNWTGVTIYIDGVEQPLSNPGSSNDGVSSNSISYNSWPAMIGGHQFRPGSALHLEGQLSDVRIWNTVRTEAQIQANMSGQLSGADAGLIGYWKLDDAPGSTTAIATNGPNGTLVNMDPANDWVTAGSNGGNTDNTVTLTVTDNNGNQSTCTATVTVEDNIAPIAECQSTTVQLDADGNGSITTADIDDSSDDACGIASLALDITAFSCDNVGNNTVELTVTDNNNNVSTCTATVTVEDNVAPVAECQPVTIQLDENGAASVTAAQADNGSDDACGIASLVLDITSFDCANLGDNTVELTVTDNNDNVSTCTAVVTVEDNIAPTITGCSDDMTVNAVAGDCSALVGLSVPVINDNCETTISVICNAPGSNIINNELGLFPVGTSTVLCIVTDAAGNADTCAFDITVIDAEAPIITNCPGNLTAENDPGECGASVFYGIITASDNCPGVTLDPISGHMVDGDDFQVGTTDVEFLASDANGNGTTCAFTVTVNDTEGPDFTCPAAITVGNDESACSAVVELTAPAITDNCDTANGLFSADGIIISGAADATASAEFPIGTSMVTFTATDLAGSATACNFSVTVEDTEAPLLPTCPRDPIMVSTSAETCDAFVDYEDIIVDDNCPGGTITSFSHDPTGATFPLGTTTVTINAADAAGNTAACVFMVTVTDDVAPNVICTPATVVLNANGVGTLTAAQVFDSASDNCGVNSTPIISNTTFSCADVGAQTVTVSVTDNNGNSGSCWAEVTVVDETAPEISCNNIEVALNESGRYSLSAEEINGGTSDACGLPTISIPATDFDCSNLGANTVSLTATDVNGNTASCTATVTVADETAPLSECRDRSVSLDASGNATLDPADFDNGSTDACGPLSFSLDLTAFDCSNVGDNDLVLTVSDGNGNSSTCAATVTIIDDTAPVAICQDITADLNDNGSISITAAMIDNGAMDACGIADLALDRSQFSCINTGDNLVTLTATDNNGNTASCTATVTIVDVTAPEALCQSASVVLSAAGEGVLTAQQIDAGSSDACGIAEVTLDRTSFFCGDLGSTPVTLTVTDLAGLSSSCTVNVLVVEFPKPEAECQDVTVDLDATGNASILPAQVNNGSPNACGLGQLSLDVSNFTCADVGDNEVTLTITNSNGNTGSCSATVTVRDVTTPDAQCANITRSLDPVTGTVTINSSDVDFQSTDACGIVDYSLSNSSFDCENVGNNVVTLTLTDANDLQSQCSAIVTILDDTAPTISCQDYSVELSEVGRASISLSDVLLSSSDICGISAEQIDMTDFDCDNLGANTVNVSVTDVNGNSTACTVNVMVNDNQSPTTLCSDQTVVLDANGLGSITPEMVDAGSSVPAVPLLLP